MLVGELGIEPSRGLTELHAAILRQDVDLAQPAPGGEPVVHPSRSLLVAALALERLEALAHMAAPLAREPSRELLLMTTVATSGELGGASARANALRASLVADGVEARSAVFTSIAPGADMARLAREHDVDLLLVDAPDGLLEDARVLALLDQVPCDVGVVVGDEAAGSGPVLVPFAGAEHDWAAVELGAWLARARSVVLQRRGRDRRRRRTRRQPAARQRLDRGAAGARRRHRAGPGRARPGSARRRGGRGRHDRRRPD